MNPFEQAVAAELSWMVRTGVPVRGLRLTVREMLVAQLGRGPLGVREVEDAVEAAVRAACRLARELDAPDELIEAVCGATLEAVRGHGGESARWLGEATGVAEAVLEELARDHTDAASWGWLARRLSRW
jgi:hypothetical protein